MNKKLNQKEANDVTNVQIKMAVNMDRIKYLENKYHKPIKEIMIDMMFGGIKENFDDIKILMIKN